MKSPKPRSSWFDLTARAFSGKVEAGLKMLHFSYCAYSDRKTGAHFCGMRASYCAYSDRKTGAHFCGMRASYCAYSDRKTGTHFCGMRAHQDLPHQEALPSFTG
jgi:hypothetical protein